jgi:SPP1 gp7 family putative phage head morphogenesis protein
MSRRRAWRIRERQAPSPDAILRVYRAWARKVATIYQAELRSALTRARIASPTRADADADQPLTSADALRARGFVGAALARAARRAAMLPMPAGAIGSTFRAAAQQAIRAERQYLVSAGADPGKLAARLAIPADRMLGVDIAPTARDAAAIVEQTREGLILVERIPKEQLAGYENWLSEALREGRRWESIQADLVDRFGIDDRHAEVIARDQTNKLNGKITESAQTAAGVGLYVWRATSDDRTRESHRAVADRVWSWGSAPPGTGPYGEAAHPGQAIQCRCGAEPVIPDDLRADFGEDGPAPRVGDVVPL